jgi:hypothetical protein
MVAWLGAWTAAPALFVGWEKAVACHEQFLARNRIIAAHRSANPEVPDFELPKEQNQSLFAFVARYFETYPPGHPLIVDHPLFRQFGALETETAYRVVRGALAVLGLALAWRFHRSWRAASGPVDLTVEWAVVCLLCALAAPLCWKQHLVVGLPAVLLVARRACAPDPRARVWLAALCAAGAAVILARHGVVGRETSILLMSYKIDTIAMLGVLALTCALPHASATSATIATIHGDTSPQRRAA